MRIARVVVAASLLAGCGIRGHDAVAWPKPSAHDEPSDKDGGESLAPHQAHAAAAAIEAEEDVRVPLPAPSVAPVAAAAVVEAVPDAAPVPAAVAEDPMMTEDIVIEVDD
jgi:hypothetical protein